MVNRKRFILVSIIITIICTAIVGFNFQSQKKINTQTIVATKILKAKQKKLKTISDTKQAQKRQTDPIAQKNDERSQAIKLIENNSNAFFKQLYTVNPKEGQEELDISNHNLRNYATETAISQTGMLRKSITNIKKYNEHVVYNSTKINVAVPNMQGICSGIAKINSLQTSINFKGRHNTDDWYLFKYDTKTQKFVEFTLLGNNFFHE